MVAFADTADGNQFIKDLNILFRDIHWLFIKALEVEDNMNILLNPLGFQCKQY